MAVAALNQSGRGTAISDASGDWLIIGWGWGFAVAFGVYVAGGISGAHINPAVTLAFAARRGFPWRKVPGYIAAQLLGAFLGAVLVYVVYKGAIDSYEHANHITRGAANSVPTYSIFATFPAEYLGNWVGPFVDQVVGTAFLVAFVFAVVDEVNQPVRANLAPVVIGFVVVAIGLSFGANAGYAINPARDFGPRLFAWIAGWGKIAIPGDYGNVNSYLWIPIVGPFRADWSAPSSTTSPSTTSSSPVARSRRPPSSSTDAPWKTRPEDMRGATGPPGCSGDEHVASRELDDPTAAEPPRLGSSSRTVRCDAIGIGGPRGSREFLRWVSFSLPE
jgi:glycerol uptake facilitator protein